MASNIVWVHETVDLLDKRCEECQGFNHHASVCWFRGSRVETHKKLSSASGVFGISSHKNEGSKRSLINEDGDYEKILENRKEKVNIPDKAGINDSGKEVLEKEQISDDEPDNTDNSELKSREKVLSEQNSLMNPEEALAWINSKLKRNYGSFSKFKNGKPLGELLTIISGYKVNSKDFWGDMADILIMEDKENDISVEKLKCSSKEEIVKFTHWLKCADEELQSQKV